MDLKLKNKRALILGGSAGIGQAIAQALIAEGARVVIASRTEKTLHDAAKAMGAAGVAVCDLSQPGAGKAAVAEAARQLGGLDIAVCNTGGPAKGKVTSISAEQWQGGFQSIFMSVVDTVNAALPLMAANRWGRILLVSSTSGREPLPVMGISNSFRAALAGLCRTLSDEIAADGVTINTLLPGYIDTQRLRDLGVKDETIAAAVPARRVGRPEEIAAVATFLASEAASYVCGQAIAVDGGRLRGL